MNPSSRPRLAGWQVAAIGAVVGLGMLGMLCVLAGYYWWAPWQQILCVAASIVVVVLVVIARLALAFWHPKI
jgi:ABC-type methionine transport system permease subunit